MLTPGWWVGRFLLSADHRLGGFLLSADPRPGGLLFKASNCVRLLPLKLTWKVTVGIPAREGRPGGSKSFPGAGTSRAHCCS